MGTVRCGPDPCDPQDLPVHPDAQVLAANTCNFGANHQGGLGLEDVDVRLPAVAAEAIAEMLD